MEEPTVRIVEEKTDGIKARTVLWYMTFFGFAINTMISINASIAIVDMIDLKYKKNVSDNKTVYASECLAINDGFATNRTEKYVETDVIGNNKSYVSIERKILDLLGVDYDHNGFKWDEPTQGVYLGSFYWLNWISQIPGGILAAKYGTKMVFGISNYAPCVLCFITPIISYLDFRVLVFVRILSGLVLGASFPAMHHLVGLWIPGNERSRFVTAYLGTAIGATVAYPIFGYIIKISSWEWIFHFCFIVGTIWFILWEYYVFDSPEQHPRIHPAEKEYIIQVLGSTVFREKDKMDHRRIPWKDILTSRCTWMAIIANAGGLWGLYTLQSQSPTYFSVIHGWNIQMVGILTGIPHLTRVLFSFLFSFFGDYLITNNKMARQGVRKLATTFNLILNGIFCLGVAYAGCNITVAVIFITISLAMHGTASTGFLAGVIDNSPNYSGVIMGIAGTFSICSGFISPMIVGYITYENQTVEAWQHIFEITAAIMIICGIIYIVFYDGSLQTWNSPKTESDKNKKLSQQLLKIKENFHIPPDP